MDDALPLSGLQHLLFCPRQCALIHLEQVWEDNASTVAGEIFHEKVDQAGLRTREGVRVARRVWLRSERLGLVGIADVVEFHSNPEGPEGRVPFPVEYKRGRPKKHLADQVQLCAQAMALEEALGVAVPRGALFYGRTRRRLDVEFTEPLREEVIAAAKAFHALMREGRTPEAVHDSRCEDCSLRSSCLPEVTGVQCNSRSYLQGLLDEDD